MKPLVLQERLNYCFAEFHDNIAIEQGNRKVSYRELDQRSNCIGRFLIDRGIKKETFIGVLASDRVNLITSIIGILKANCVFATLDPAYPEKRLAAMIEDAGIQYILCDKHDYTAISPAEKKQGIEFFIIEDILSREAEPGFTEKIDAVYDGEDRVYLYFTSGTTGQPKAVVGRNKGLMHFINWELEEFSVGETFRFSQFTTPGFDVFLRDIFVPLSAGATICIPVSKEIYLEARQLVQWVEDQRINFIHCVPTLFRLFNAVEPGPLSGTLSSLEYILLAGERTNPADLERWYARYGEKVQLVNLYGPTETTLAKVFYRIHKEDAGREIIPIGKPIPGARVIILDENMRLCDELEAGELYIRTPYRTYGYHNDPVLNQRKFIPNPFSDNPDDIIYRTGDLGRFLPDGNIELLGRLDRQVKIRGMRIELEELESILAAHPDVKEAAVIKQEHGGDGSSGRDGCDGRDNVSLAALVTLKPGAPVDSREKSFSDYIKKYLYERLPDYMVPAVIKKIDSMPRKPNLKIDFEALVQLYQWEQEKDYIPPGNAIEKNLVEIWSGLLGIAKNKISVTDSFFELGGNSLNVMTLISRIQQEWDVRLPLGAVFNNHSIRQLAVLVEESGREKYAAIEPAELKEYYVLSSGQKRLYVIRQMEPESTNYNMPALAVLEGRLDQEKLQEVFRHLIARHDILRTSFHLFKDEPVQKIHPRVDFEIELAEVFGPTFFQKGGFIRPFDLSKAPLVRVGLVKQAEDKHILMFDWHHIITDGVSLGIFTREFMLMYAGETLAPVRLSYRDYAEWQYWLRLTNALQKQEDYWLKQFAGELPVLELPLDFKRPGVQRFEGASFDFFIDHQTGERINALALAENVTPYILLLGFFNIFLAKLSGVEDIVCGTPIAGRSHPDLEQIIGMFVNTLALRNPAPGEETFIDFLRQLKENTLRAFENQDYQYEDLVEKVDRTRDISRNPLFDVMFVFQDIDIPLVKVGDLKFIPYPYREVSVKFDLLLTIEQTPEHMVCTFEYSTALFKKETIEGFAGYFREIVMSILDNSGLRIAEIEMISPDDRKKLLVDFNNTGVEYPADKTIHQLFEEQVVKTSDRVGLVGQVGPVSITYRYLNEQSDCFAGLLIEKGVLPDCIVGIMMDRSIEMIIAIYGILKAGSAYLPIDPEYPQERIDYMLKDSRAAILLTDNKKEIIVNCKLKNMPKAPLYHSNKLAYIIYTSGSTGHPKGVMVEHRSVVNYIKWAQEFYFQGEPYDFALYSSLSFDLTVTSIYTPLLSGGKILIYPGDDSASIISKILQEDRVQAIKLTPTHLKMVKELFRGTVKNIKKLIIGGEDLSVELAREIYQLFQGNIEIYNEYGPTEATVGCMIHKFDPAVDCRQSVPIGVPIANASIYILDNYRRPVVVGVAGELYIAGDGLAWGYLNRPELTAEKFIKNRSYGLYRTYINYKTSDLARWLNNGSIEFLGRSDLQVKIRGFRIELGEIENRLLTYPGMKEAAAVIRKNQQGDNSLCAYLVSNEELSLSELRNFLVGCLPAYLVPSFFVPLTEFPLTPSGKIDRKRLPEPGVMDLTGDRAYVAPGNDIEKELVRVWQDLLGKNPISIDDNFFELGGDSIRAIQVVSRMRTAGYKVEMRDILKLPRIADLALTVKKISPAGESIPTNKTISLIPGDITYPGLSRAILEGLQKRFSFSIEDIYPLSPMQEGMLFHALYGDNEIGTYFEQISYRVQGELDVSLVEKSLNLLFKRHGILRTLFINDGLDRPLQLVLKDRGVEFYYGDLENRVTEELDKESLVWEFKEQDRQRSFDLSRDVLMRAAVLRTGNNEYAVVWSFHHILLDGWSTGILIDELFKIYDALRKNREYRLPPARPYGMYIQWLGQQDKEKSAEYWANYLDDYSHAVGLPRFTIDGLSKSEKGYKKGQTSFTLGREIIHRMNQLARAGNITLNTVIQVLWGILLGEYNDRRDVVFGTVVSGRPGEIEGVESMVGLFINTVPVRIRFEEDAVFSRLLTGVQQDALESTPHHYASLADIQAAHPLKQNLLDHILVFENYPVTKQIAEVTTLNLSNIEIFEQSNYDFNVIVGPGEEICISIDFNAHVYENRFVEQIAGQFKYILEQAPANWNKKIADFTFLSEDDRRLLLIEFNRTEAQYPTDKTIHQLFEEQVVKRSDRVGLVGQVGQVGRVGQVGPVGPASITYRQLNEQSNQLAGLLVEKGVLADSIVGIMMDRSIEMIIAIYGILKAGGAYLPIDPVYPQERIDYILKDSGATILLTDNKKEIIVNCQLLIINCKLKNMPKAPLYSSNKLAYIIYTSGSTGRPKGVLVSHKNVVRLFFNNRVLFDFNSRDVWTMFHSYCFDFSVWEMYGALLFGGKLILISRLTAIDTGLYLQILKKEAVTILNQTPSAFYRLLEEEAQRPDKLLYLRYVIFGGEALNPGKLKQWQQYYSKTKLINMYGITETTVHVTYKEITGKEIEAGISNIGKPIPTLSIYVMNSRKRLVPVGAPGEIYVGGAGVARGYLNKPELTSEKFIKNRPYGAFRTYINYKTGDLARWLPDGNLQFLGRIDHQVKIRGFRIELEEVENCLLKHPHVKDAVVTIMGDREEDKNLSAYFVGTCDTSELKSYLSRTLPDYMVPVYFVELEKIPLTVNGKVDYGALPKPGIKRGSNYVAPGNVVEEQLAQIWAEVLAIGTPIGIHDNFFELGGHSLKATTLAAKIHEKLNIKLPLSELFSSPTISELAVYIANASQNSFKTIEASEKREYYTLSSAQERLFFLQHMEPTATAYNLPQFFTFESDPDIEKLTGAFQRLIQRHDSLRTSFHIIDDQPVQRVHDEVEFEIENFATDLHGQTRTLSKEEVIIKSFIRPFDLSCAPLLCVGIGEIQGGRQLFLVDLHHIIADGLSLQVLIRDFSALYTSQYLTPLRLQYKDFSQWQASQDQQEKIKQQESYWLKEFAEEGPVLDLPADFARPALQSYEGKSVDFRLSEEESRQLKALALKEDATLFMVLLAVFNAWAAKLSGREDVVIGVPIAGRRHADLQQIMGMFVNTLPIRNFPTGEKNFIDFLTEVKNKTLQAFENQDYQFETLVEKLDLERDPSRNPLFDIMLVLNNFDDAPREVPGGLRLTPYHYDTGTAKFDLVLTVMEKEGILSMDFQYCSQLFDSATIERFMGYFRAAAASIILEPGKRMADIDILSEEEKKKLLVDFNDSAATYPAGKTLHQLFEEQVEKMSDAVGLVGPVGQVGRVGLVGLVSITYRQLNEQSNCLAWLLVEKGVLPGNIVGIMMELCIEMIIGVLGILKAGSAYLPIDPEYPQERIDYMLKDSGAAILLTDNKKEKIVNCQLLIINCKLKNMPKAPLYHSNKLAYIIYTSGSTGKPKGVMVEHRSLVNYIKWAQEFYFQEKPCDFALYSSLSFDLTVTSIYTPLLSGGKIVIYPGNDSEFVISRILRDDRVQVIKLTPTHLKMAAEMFPGVVKNIKKLIVGGEDLATELACEVHRLFKGNIEIYNEYGPTEATVGCMIHRFDPVVDCDGCKQSVPIGVPIVNTNIYILDNYQCPAAAGVAGELHIGGDGLARGYLNKPELTAEKFFKNRSYESYRTYFNYKTGDLARWLNNGSIEFLGRRDHQVKIRGFRIETGEIEKHLSCHGEIKDAVVTVVENIDGKIGRHLCAYIVPKTPQSPDINTLELRDYLNGFLPAYMIPTYFVPLSMFPLTPSGKIDRKALPLPQPGIITGENYAAPQNELEKVLVENWQEILGVEKIGINDNFFQVGGDSIDAIRLASRLLQRNLKLQVKDLFLYPTIAQLSRYIKQVHHETHQGIVEGEVKLTPIQEWFFREYVVDRHHYNQSAMLYREQGFREEDLRKIFSKIVEHHDALRMVYRVEANGAVQWNRGVTGRLFDLEIINLTDKAGSETEIVIEKETCRIEAGIDLENGPLMKLGLFKTKKGDYLLIVIHHLVIDGVSWRILLEDFTILFNRLTRKEDMELPLKTTSFMTWAEEIHRYGNTEQLAEEMAYWRKIEQEEYLPLPKDRPVGERKRKDSGKISFRLTEEMTGRLLKEANKAYNTEINDILLSALGLALNDWTGGERFLIQLEGHGREYLFEGIDISRTVGWFTSLYPVLLDMRKAYDISQAIKNTKEMLRNIPNKGIGYGILKYLNKQPLTLQAKPEICFNYLGQFDGDLDTGIFQLADIGGGYSISPESQNLYALDISGAIARRELTISLDYNRMEYDEKTIAGFAERFEIRLKQIITHCSGKKETELTVSDFSSPGINETEVAAIFNELEDTLGEFNHV